MRITGTLRNCGAAYLYILSLAFAACGGDDRPDTNPAAAGNAGAPSNVAGSAGTGGLGAEAGAGGSAVSGAGGTVNAVAGAAGQAGAPVSMDVHGTVFNVKADAPMANVAVVIGDKSVLTDAQGRFTIANVGATYDVMFALGGQSVQIFQGLTRRDPTFRVEGPRERTHAIYLSGSITGAKNGPNEMAVVGYRVQGSQRQARLLQNQGPEFTGLDFDWYGANSIAAELQALKFEVNSEGYPINYLGYGKTKVDLYSGADKDKISIPLAPLEDRELKHVLGIPAGYSLVSWAVSHGYLPIINPTVLPSTFATYRVPKLSDGTPLYVYVSSKKGDEISLGSFLVSEQTNEIVTISQRAPALGLPVDQATLVDHSTQFSWEAFPNGVHHIVFMAGAYTIQLMTKETTVKLPDLRSIGMALPKGASFTWRVLGLGPAKSIDELAGPKSPLESVGAEHRTISAARAFTTAP